MDSTLCHNNEVSEKVYALNRSSTDVLQKVETEKAIYQEILIIIINHSTMTLVDKGFACKKLRQEIENVEIGFVKVM